jgi:hypothetical protein
MLSGRREHVGPESLVAVSERLGEQKEDAPEEVEEVTPQAEDKAADEEREATQAERAEAIAAMKDDVANRHRRIREMVNRIEGASE